MPLRELLLLRSEMRVHSRSLNESGDVPLERSVKVAVVGFGPDLTAADEVVNDGLISTEKIRVHESLPIVPVEDKFVLEEIHKCSLIPANRVSLYIYFMANAS